MTRSFDRRVHDAYARYFLAEIEKEKEEPVSLDLDCMCKKNDPNCEQCWEGSPLVADDTDWAGKELGKFKIVKNHKGELLPVLSQFDVDVRNRFDECLELLLRKHKDYSGKNIAQSPGGALNGLRVRMHDKMARINNLIDTGVSPEYEPLRDSFVDLANYSVIALMVLDGRWPE